MGDAEEEEDSSDDEEEEEEESDSDSSRRGKKAKKNKGRKSLTSYADSEYISGRGKGKSTGSKRPPDVPKAYLEDPIMTAEFTVYLQQNFCTNEMGPRCHEAIAHHFPAMHAMAMEKFFIPQEICNQEPVCTGEEPTKPF